MDLRKFIRATITECLNESQQKYVSWKDLDNETQVDIIENVYHNSPYLENNWNIWTFKEFVDGAEDIPKFKIEYKDVNALYKQLIQIGWGISSKNAETLVSALKGGTELQPIIVNGDKFFDGGHRLTAYKKLGKKNNTSNRY